MRFPTRSAIVVIGSLTALIAACSSDKKGGAGAGADSAVANAPLQFDSLDRPIGKVVRPPTVNSVMKVNGSNQIQVREIVLSSEFMPLQYTTYKPAAMQIGSSKIGSLATETYTPMLGSQTDPTAYVQVQMDSSALAPVDPATAAIKAIAATRKVTDLSISDAPGYAWAKDAKQFSFKEGGATIAGTIIVGNRGPVKYVFISQSPVAQRSEMAPRLKMLLEQWRWEDDGSYLVPAPPKTVSADSTATAPVPAPAKAPAKANGRS
jgi:hypothetical protein